MKIFISKSGILSSIPRSVIGGRVLGALFLQNLNSNSKGIIVWIFMLVKYLNQGVKMLKASQFREKVKIRKWFWLFHTCVYIRLFLYFIIRYITCWQFPILKRSGGQLNNGGWCRGSGLWLRHILAPTHVPPAIGADGRSFPMSRASSVGAETCLSLIVSSSSELAQQERVW